MKNQAPFTPEQEARIREMIREEAAASKRAYREYLNRTKADREAFQMEAFAEFMGSCSRKEQ